MNNNLHMISRFGECSSCGAPLEALWFIEYEYKTFDGHLYKTGRRRRAVDYLLCTNCYRHVCIDDSFDGPWF